MALLAEHDGLLTLAFFVLAKGLKDVARGTEVIERVALRPRAWPAWSAVKFSTSPI